MCLHLTDTLGYLDVPRTLTIREAREILRLHSVTISDVQSAVDSGDSFAARLESQLAAGIVDRDVLAVWLGY